MKSFGYEFTLQVANFAGTANLKLIIFQAEKHHKTIVILYEP